MRICKAAREGMPSSPPLSAVEKVGKQIPRPFSPRKRGSETARNDNRKGRSDTLRERWNAVSSRVPIGSTDQVRAQEWLSYMKQRIPRLRRLG
jgi:hypothetical protein